MGWSEQALNEATSGWPLPVLTTERPDEPWEPIVHVKTWKCGSDGHVVARSTPDGTFDLTATCKHRLHHELGQYPMLAVTDPVLLDRNGKAVQYLPADATGYVLQFTLGNLVLQQTPIVVVRCIPDPAGPGDIAHTERWNAGKYESRMRPKIVLTGHAEHERKFTVQIVDPETASRRWTAPGVEIWCHRVMVE